MIIVAELSVRNEMEQFFLLGSFSFRQSDMASRLGSDQWICSFTSNLYHMEMDQLTACFY